MDHLLTEARNPHSTHLDRLTPLEIAQLMCREDANAVRAVERESPKIAHAIEVVTDRLRQGGRLVYIGAGTSGRLGVLDASECPPTFSSDPSQVRGLIAGGEKALTTAVEGAEDHPEFAVRDLQSIHFSSRDVLVGIATSGRTPYVIGGLRYARELGAFAIGLSCVEGAELESVSDLHLNPLTGPEVLTGSTRLKAGTATKLILNMLTTGSMVHLGKTLGNLMVDLRATNVKLKARTNRILRHFTGLSAEDADGVLARCDGELKTALVAHLANLEATAARERLKQADGKIQRVLHDLSGSPTPLTYSDLWIGIDGGGTKTSVLLARGDRRSFQIVGRGASGPSNVHGVGFQSATRNLEEGIGRAFEDAKRKSGRVAGICFGLAGAGRKDDQDRLIEWAKRQNLADRIDVRGDVELLLHAEGGAGHGIAVVCGTGSVVWGRSPTGEIARAGGWGPLLGDETSGYGLVLAAVRAVLLAAEGRGPRTLLTEMLSTAFEVDDPNRIVSRVHSGEWDRTRIADLAPRILDAEERGDEVAVSLVDTLHRQTAEAVLSVKDRLKLEGKTTLALTGGLLLNSACFRNRLLRPLAEKMDFEPRLVFEPARGAIELARALN
jgi:N-acetylmuramic acid 6-phosphate etherase